VVDLVIKNCKIVYSSQIVEAGIAIENGKIVIIAKNPLLPKADAVIDARGNYVFPGVIDAHAHIHDVKYLSHEDFKSGSIAAAAGGITCFIEITLETPVVTPEQLKNKIKIGEKESIVDFSLHAGNMKEEYIKYVSEDVKIGVKSFKAFLSPPYRINIMTLQKMMTEIAKCKGIQFLHAEDGEIVEYLEKEIKRLGLKKPADYLASRPNVAEREAIARALRVVKTTNCHLHIAHVTTKEGVYLIEEAKKSGLPVTAETCPQYLLFTAKDLEKWGPYLKMFPVLKSEKDREILWEALENGTIDIVVTDHAPSPREEKEVGWGNIWEAWGGVPGVETLLPIMLSEGVNKGRISISRLYEVLCEKPAKIYGLYPRKGVINVGSDADLVIVDLKKETTIKADMLHYKCGWTPYEGMKVKGWPKTTIIRGKIVASEGEIFEKPGYGKFVLMQT